MPMGDLDNLLERKVPLGCSSKEKQSGGSFANGLIEIIREGCIVETNLHDFGSGSPQSVIIIIAMSPLDDHFILHALRVGQPVHPEWIKTRHTGCHPKGQPRRGA